MKFQPYLSIENILTTSKTFQLWREGLLDSRRTSNVWLPSISCLRPIRTCFSVMCLCLDENDGMPYQNQTRLVGNKTAFIILLFVLCNINDDIFWCIVFVFLNSFVVEEQGFTKVKKTSCELHHFAVITNNLKGK